MLTGVPYNVNVPEFQPERSAPVFPVVTRKYPCIEDVVTQDFASFDTLTWKIQQPDQSMVWQSVKLVLPMEMKSYRVDDTNANDMPHADAELDMRVSSKRPSCNIALAESPMGAFRQSSLTINGRIFSEENRYRRVLDACYRGTGPSSYGDNHSLKPIVSRDIWAEGRKRYPAYSFNALGQRVPLVDAGNQVYVNVMQNDARTLDSAFSLLEHNGPFIERARKFQDELSYDGKTWTGLITNYLELGPFQARARASNTAVPYVRDLHLRLNFDTNPSKFDSVVGHEMNGLPLASCRTIPAKLFEFGTVANLKHFGESVNRYDNFICGMKLRYTEKPYLEVQYVRYIEPMKSFYNLRCFEYQYEQSNPFVLKPASNTRDSPTSLQRVTSRLLSYPTKVYLYADFADSDQHPYGLGNVRRSCLLKNIHCRVNQRPDIIFNPSQEECYQMFRRHTNSSLEYGAWLKAPIYVFDPVDLGQPDFLANDARLSLMEWDAEVSLTALQMQEILDLKNPQAILNEGYSRQQFEANQFIDPPLLNEYSFEWFFRTTGTGSYDPGRTNYEILLASEQAEADDAVPFETADANAMVGRYLQFHDLYYNNTTYASPTNEIIKISTVTSATHVLRGFIWAAVTMATGQVLNNKLYYVPTSYEFNVGNGKPNFINAWSALTTTVVPGAANNPDTYTYAVNHNTINVFTGTVVGGALNGTTFNDHTNGAQVATPGARAFVTSRLGVYNNQTGGGAPAPAGLYQPGGTFAPVDQRANNHVQWVCFRPSTAMVAGTDPDSHVIRWKRDFPARAQPIGKLVQTGKANYCLLAKGALNRNQIAPIVQPLTPNLLFADQTGTSYPLYHLTLHDRHTHAFDYTLKALYEYGNCQYQFTSDGAPTKVLPNLVPVRDSSAIPIV